MKRIILSGLSLLLLSTAAAPAVYAQTTSEAPPENAETLGMAVTPFNLVFLAYQGFFESEGIPKFNQLISDYAAGRVTPEDLVEVAISMRRLPAETMSNRGYLFAVERQLDSLLGGMNR
jgi:hypothetical protein